MIKKTNLGNYESTGFHCMSCGQKEIWRSSLYDHYSGNMYVCLSCGHYLWSTGINQEDKDSKEIREDIQNDRS